MSESNNQEFLNNLKSADVIEYKGILFDCWTVDSETGGVWGEMCEGCAQKYKDVLADELSDGGVGSCSVRLCDVVGLDSDNERHFYVDFQPELIHPLTIQQMYTLYPEQQTLDEKIATAMEKLSHEPPGEVLDRNGISMMVF